MPYNHVCKVYMPKLLVWEACWVDVTAQTTFNNPTSAWHSYKTHSTPESALLTITAITVDIWARREQADDGPLVTYHRVWKDCKPKPKLLVWETWCVYAGAAQTLIQHPFIHCLTMTTLLQDSQYTWISPTYYHSTWTWDEYEIMAYLRPATMYGRFVWQSIC